MVKLLAREGEAEASNSELKLAPEVVESRSIDIVTKVIEEDESTFESWSRKKEHEEDK